MRFLTRSQKLNKEDAIRFGRLLCPFASSSCRHYQSTCSSAASVHQIHLRAPTVNVKSPQNGNLLGSHIQQQPAARSNDGTDGPTDRQTDARTFNRRCPAYYVIRVNSSGVPSWGQGEHRPLQIVASPPPNLVVLFTHCFDAVGWAAGRASGL